MTYDNYQSDIKQSEITGMRKNENEKTSNMQTEKKRQKEPCYVKHGSLFVLNGPQDDEE